MTDFVLSQEIKGMEVQSLLHQQSSRADRYNKMIKYANFLKKPLTLDMFIGDDALFEDSDKVKFKLNYTIEDLVEYNLTLTPYAIKQLGL